MNELYELKEFEALNGYTLKSNKNKNTIVSLDGTEIEVFLKNFLCLCNGDEIKGIVYIKVANAGLLEFYNKEQLSKILNSIGDLNILDKKEIRSYYDDFGTYTGKVDEFYLEEYNWMSIEVCNKNNTYYKYYICTKNNLDKYGLRFKKLLKDIDIEED